MGRQFGRVKVVRGRHPKDKTASDDQTRESKVEEINQHISKGVLDEARDPKRLATL